MSASNRKSYINKIAQDASAAEHLDLGFLVQREHQCLCRWMHMMSDNSAHLGPMTIYPHHMRNCEGDKLGKFYNCRSL